MVKDLMEFGLSEKEAKVYLALLELGLSPATEIAQAAGVKRPSTYVILENLMKQGFVSLAQNDAKQQYLASSPEIFLRLAEKRADRETGRRDRIKDLIPELKGLNKGTKKKPKVRVFEGKEGLINALQEGIEAARSEKLYRAFTSGETGEMLPDFTRAWVDMDIKLGIKLKGIYVDNPMVRKMMKMREKLYSIVYLPKEKHPLPVEMMIAGDKMGYLSVKKGNITTILMEDREIVTAMKAMFDLAFEEVKRIGDYQEKD